MPSACSGGEAQRVALARTLVTNPSTFLLDEPLSSLDAKLRRELRAECDRLHQELKKTFIFVTHDQEEAMTLADRIVVMRAGDIEQVGSPMEIYSNPVTDFVADFFGSPSMNLIAGEIVGENGAAALPLAAHSRSRCRSGSRRAGRSGDARHPARAPARAARPAPRPPISICRSASSSRSARTRCFISISAPSGRFIAVSEGLAMAEMEAGDRVALTLTRDRPICSAPMAGASRAAREHRSAPNSPQRRGRPNRYEIASLRSQ